MENRKIKIGIILGSGFGNPRLLERMSKRRITTPFGEPSDVLIEGHYKNVPCVLLLRHGREHQYQPSDVNYRANISALRDLGCTHILATTVTRSLTEKYAPDTFIILDDFIDRTGRPCTFYDRTKGGPAGVCHIPMQPAFCEKSRQALFKAARDNGLPCLDKGTVVVIQGPRFSTRAESLALRQLGAHLVNMTTVPEAILAKEAGMSYAAVALVKDYDCGRTGTVYPFTVDPVATFSRNVNNMTSIILGAICEIAKHTDLDYLQQNKDLVSSSVMLKNPREKAYVNPKYKNKS